MPRARSVDFQKTMWLARQPYAGALLAAQHHSAASDVQGSGNVVFAGRQHHRARHAVQRRLDARRIVAGRGREPLSRGRRR